MKFFTEKKLKEYVDQKLEEMAERAVSGKVEQITEQVACQIVGSKRFEEMQAGSEAWYKGGWLANAHDVVKFYVLMGKASDKILEAQFFDNGKEMLKEEIKSPEVIKVLVRAINEYQVKSK